MEDVADAQVTAALQAEDRAFRRQARRSQVIRLLGLVLPVAAYGAYAALSDNRLVPDIAAIIEALVELTLSGDLWYNARQTLQYGFTGLALALVAGVLVGFAMARSRIVDAALGPFMDGVYPIPKLALYPIIILIFGLGAASKVWQVGIECFFPIVYNVYAGARDIDRNFLWLSRSVGASEVRTIRDVILPSTAPAILTGLRVAAPIMLIVITVTELLGVSRGLGFLIADARANFDPARALAVVVVLGVLGFVFDRVIVWLTNRVVFWEEQAHV
jgi:ABC-type nitrate/sulfonate/bicarbonate transport system permease component